MESEESKVVETPVETPAPEVVTPEEEKLPVKETEQELEDLESGKKPGESEEA